MAMNQIQFQRGMPLPEFLSEYGTESQCRRAVQDLRWPDGFRCPRCGNGAFWELAAPRHRYQCSACRHQTSLIAGTIFASTKLPLTTWFLAIYLISQAKTGLSALALKRQLGVSYPTAWKVHHKIFAAMAKREESRKLSGSVQLDDAYLGGEHRGKHGRGSENKVPFVAALSMTEEGHPLHMKLATVSAFTQDAIKVWAMGALMPGAVVLSDGMGGFTGIAAAGFKHERFVVGGIHPRDLPQFKWINTVLGNLKMTLAGAFHAFKFKKYATSYLAEFAYRFNHRFDLARLVKSLIRDVALTPPKPERAIRQADERC